MLMKKASIYLISILVFTLAISCSILIKEQGAINQYVQETLNGTQSQGAIGFLSLSTIDKELIKNIGQPKTKSEEVVWESDGLEHQTWTYEDKGIELGMIRNKREQQVWSIKITSPCDYKTNKNIGIGSSKIEVINAYKDRINEEHSVGNQDIIVLGSVYNGMIFHFENNKVASIFIGAAAE